MKLIRSGGLCVLLALVAGCSLAPEKPVTKRDLFSAAIYSDYSIKDSPESVLAALNRDGEVVVEGKSKWGKDYYLKILATPKGLKVRTYPK
jgi:hypothetical protein